MEYKSITNTCQNCKKEFIVEPDDFGFYERMGVPPPTFCPECRFQRRLLFRNNRVFYKRKCGLCDKSILSTSSQAQPFVIYCMDCWLSDKWDPLSYGKEYDFNTPFFSQFMSLAKVVPRENLYQTNFVSSEYCNYGLDFKECYLLFGGKGNERVYFGNQVLDSRDSLDVAFSEKVEFCYDLFECQRNNMLFFSHHSNDCVDSMYLVDCRNCMNCFGCVGLANKQYHIYNQPYSKEEYQKFIENNNIGSYEQHKKNQNNLSNLYIKVPHRFARIYKSVNASGDDLAEVRNTHVAFSTRQSEDSKFLFFVRNQSKDCYDNTFQGFNSEQVYEIAHGFGGNNMAFGVKNHFNRDARYNEECHECSDIFGCEGLRKKSYCVLNKQYTKEEYKKLVPKIIEHMNTMPYADKKGIVYKYGEFFPAELSPFAYNESIAQEYFPLTKDEARSMGYAWSDSTDREYKTEFETEAIPDRIQDTKDDIVGKVIACAHHGKCKDQCTEAFKIIPEEFKFYKRMSIPLPRLCPNCRHYERLMQRNPLTLWHRQCMCDREGHDHESRCPNKFETSYSTERPEIVYCESCYQREVY